MTTFAEATTTGVGGPILDPRRAERRDELIGIASELLDDPAAPFLVLGGGSNTLVGDEGFEGPTLLVRTRGIEFDDPDDSGRVLVRAEAGEQWDALVRESLARGLRGIEMLSGIPGSVGAAPVQNIGAYGGELSGVLARIEAVLSDGEGARWIGTDELGLAYRTSALKRGELGGIVTRVELRLEQAGDGLAAPVGYAQLAQTLDIEVGDRVPLQTLRAAVVRLRASKGMVLDPNDPDSVSTGSFFVNPIVRREFASSLPAALPRFEAGRTRDDERLVKISAAWLIDHAGVRKGYSLPGSHAAISQKHVLAIVNTGGATAAEIAELARFVRQRVLNEFGVTLVPEPNLYGLEV